MKLNEYISERTFNTELGSELSELRIAYHTVGQLNTVKDNVIWVCHALTANSDVAEWWPTLYGEGNLFDPSKYFIVCANILGSCYGTTGPGSIGADTRSPDLLDFPVVTVRDMAKAHALLRQHLGIERIHLGIGGSLGGYQLLEWEMLEPGTFKNLCLLVTCAKESPWRIGIHTAQRMAIESDPNWGRTREAGYDGVRVARAIGMLTYRNYQIFCQTQADEDERVEGFNASSYLEYQGTKLADRFSAYSYWFLTKAMDSHNLARGRGNITDVLGQIGSRNLVVGVSSDILCPTPEQQFLAEYLPNAEYVEIDSPYGHDGFLVEGEKIRDIIFKSLY